MVDDEVTPVVDKVLGDVMRRDDAYPMRMTLAIPERKHVRRNFNLVTNGHKGS